MPSVHYEIRKCDSCGLRYPLETGHPFGTRCPACLGETRVVLNRQLSDETSQIRPSTNKPAKKRRAVLLDNIRSAWNVGSIFRSADGFGFDHAYCCGITPTPEMEAVTKTSLGAEETVTWSYHKDAVKLVTTLKKEGFSIFALEEDEGAVSLNSASSTAQYEVLIVGNEVTGVDPELLSVCDKIFYIPMLGEKKSFNVAIAFGITAYALR